MLIDANKNIERFIFPLMGEPKINVAIDEIFGLAKRHAARFSS